LRIGLPQNQHSGAMEILPLPIGLTLLKCRTEANILTATKTDGCRTSIVKSRIWNTHDLQKLGCSDASTSEG
jgi:hypothetical protein